MKKLLISVGCALSLVAGQALADKWDTVRIAVDVPYEPFEYKKPDGTLTGFEVELGNAACEEIKAKCEWIVQAWDGIIPGLLARKYDAIMSSMSITAERAEKVLFSEGYYNTPTAWFGKKENASLDVTSKDALNGKTIGVQRGTVQDNYATENFGSVADIKRYSTADDLVLDLQGGRLDVVVLDFPVGEQTIMNDDKYDQIGERFQLGEGIGMAFRKRDKELAAKFNAALDKLKKNGTYDTIMKKYFTYDIKI
ncbi:transporter substrate-binding domain-containing protein [Hahella ganghwensis]|uniref:transporter substrate-binding domain-containing protein n=1 Tax=Hahella ganghwensis TaxID=286420 RepID=UPI000382752B|nr:transporter substrate-binding domain-containing protein [Hahella ganghwensis]